MIPLKQPLASMTVKGWKPKSKWLKQFEKIIMAECNVKKIYWEVKHG